MEQLTKKEIQQIQLEILDTVDQFCADNNITYYLTGGSMIGALRHDGFIPWDDDIDIMMYRDEYEKFIEEFNKSQTKYHAFSIDRDSGYNSHFCKISDMSTVLVENVKPHDIEIGVNIDLFPLDKLPPNVNEQKLLDKLHHLDLYYHCKSVKGASFKLRSFKQKIKIVLCKFLSFTKTRYKLSKAQSDIAKLYNCTETDEYSIITCHMRKRFPLINRTQTTVERHIFEGRFYNIPSSYDRYLTMQFGDYMTPPPLDKRASGHSFVAYKK